MKDLLPIHSNLIETYSHSPLGTSDSTVGLSMGLGMNFCPRFLRFFAMDCFFAFNCVVILSFMLPCPFMEVVEGIEFGAKALAERMGAKLVKANGNTNFIICNFRFSFAFYK